MTTYGKLVFSADADDTPPLPAPEVAAFIIRRVAQWRRDQDIDGTCSCNNCIDDLADEIEAM
jgi:hypothetical protein